MVKNCKKCDKVFRQKVGIQEYCTNECRESARVRIAAYDGVSTGKVGAVSELIISADLLKHGYNVFRAVSQSCDCDLIIEKKGKLFKVEVTGGYLNRLGKLNRPTHKLKDQHKFDILAIYIHKTSEIQYVTNDQKNKWIPAPS